ncbi:hypothetical protein [Mucilaginibacter sp. UR6-11]|uniref:hypothetical protein n=1 Tax=Mucilaginibacter sp. UR6-11 TaxID=1435644 RepID=UPI001E296294|nr:hypothetical protein [Mucilaginibacter sp. UR6-11]MCC8424629.1 hypothetical protein [Mucilaginibacter sp. UR6-11]
MRANKKDAFKKVIKLAAEDKAAVNFTGSIMNSIHADVQREAVLKSILQRQPTESPAFDFTITVMAQIAIKARPANIYKPIITSKAWYGIAAMVAVFLILIGLSNPAGRPASTQNPTLSLSNHINAIPPIYFMTIIIAGTLLFIDYLITQRSKRGQTGRIDTSPV